MSNNLGYPVPTNYRPANRNPVNQFVSPGHQGNPPLRPSHLPISRQSRVSSIPQFQSIPHNVITNRPRQNNNVQVSNPHVTNTGNNLNLNANSNSNSNIDIDTNVQITPQNNPIPNSLEASNPSNPSNPNNPTIELLNDKIVKLEKEYQHQFGELNKMVQTLKDHCGLLETNHHNLSSVLTNIVDELSQNPDEDIVLTQVDNNLDFEMMKNLQGDSHLNNSKGEGEGEDEGQGESSDLAKDTD